MLRSRYITLTGALVAGTAGAGALGAVQNEKPNILLIFVDDMGYKDTGFTGSDYYETPVLDSLAARSMIFNNAYACAGNSAPSRACLISGQYTPRHGIFAVTSTKRGPKEQMRLEPYPNRQDLPLETYTVADAMTQAGYRTALIGKWHLGRTEEFYPDKQGFSLGYVDNIPDKEEFQRTNDPKNIFKEVDMMCSFFEETAASGEPFFAFLPMHAVHYQWQARQEYIDYFESKTKGKQHDQALYAAMIKHVDDAVGMLIAKLRDLGMGDNTLILFTSDNGGVPATSQAPLRGYKGCMYDGGIRVPMFVHYPGRIAAGSSDIPVQNVDFFPTFIDFAGFTPPSSKILDGESLKPLLTGAADKLERESIFWHFPGYLDRPCPGGRDKVFRQRPSTVMRKGDWKISLFYEEWMLDGGRDRIDTNNSIELYNLADDPGEKKNLASKNKQMRDRLLDELLEWVEYTQAPLPTLIN